MSEKEHLSEERLNALLDREITERERLDILDAIKQDPEYARLFFELQNNDEIIKFVYNNPPPPRYDPFQSVMRQKRRPVQMLAAGILLVVGVATGWQLQQHVAVPTDSNIREMSQIDFSRLKAEKVLMHISHMDPERVNEALDKTEYLLEQAKDRSLQVEIVANASGIDLLRSQSPYAQRLQSLVKKHDNVSLKACGIAMQAVKLQEHKEMELLPEADKVPAALDEILKRVKEGWLYIKA